MEIDGKNIKMFASEVNPACPLNPRWAAGVISRLGLPLAEISEKLFPLTRCPAVLEAAGYTVKIVADGPDPDTPPNVFLKNINIILPQIS